MLLEFTRLEMIARHKWYIFWTYSYNTKKIEGSEYGPRCQFHKRFKCVTYGCSKIKLLLFERTNWESVVQCMI
jgi:hypothetical protein